jgi:hypothetical protein
MQPNSVRHVYFSLQVRAPAIIALYSARLWAAIKIMWLEANFLSAINQMSAFGGKADIGSNLIDVRY